MPDQPRQGSAPRPNGVLLQAAHDMHDVGIGLAVAVGADALKPKQPKDDEK